MTQAESEAYEAGIVPEEHEARFVAQHFCAYVFAQAHAKGKRVLEIGFGEGYGANALADVAQEVLGVDHAPGNIPRASAKYPKSNLRFQRMEGTHLAFPDTSFDVVGSFQVIEHVPEPQLFTYLSEIKRVLRPHGLLCVSTLNLDHNRKPGKPYEKLACHEKEFTAPELRALLEQVFPVVEMYGLHLTMKHRVFLRLKRWGLDTYGPAHLNPVRAFHAQITARDFVVTPDVSRSAIDLYAVCRLSETPSAS